jgi:hypothetical protein
MQKISMADLKNRLRKNFRDDYKIQWSEALLDEILYEAQREYALYSGGLVGRHDAVSSGSPVLSLPEDFFQIISATDPEGNNIPVVSYRKLAENYGDFRKDKGNKVKAFCFNFDSFGKFRIYPQLPEGTFAGTIYYKRLPREGEWAAVNAAAVEQYALFLMYQFTGKSMAQNCFAAFMDAIYKEQKQQLDAGSKNIVRTGVYF